MSSAAAKSAVVVYVAVVEAEDDEDYLAKSLQSPRMQLARRDVEDFPMYQTPVIERGSS